MQKIKKILRSIWFGRSKFLNIPLPCFLPFGKLFLAYGDEIGASIFLKKYENEWKIMPKILKEGMVFLILALTKDFILYWPQAVSKNKEKFLLLNQ